MSQLHLTKAQRRQVEAIADVLRPWGLAWDLTKQGAHLKLRIQGPKGVGGVWPVIIPGTPKNEDDAVKSVAAEARRVLTKINARLSR